MAEVGSADVPVLADMLADERSVIRMLAGSILADLGQDGVAALRRAAESQDPMVRRTAETALMGYEIIRSQAQPQK